MNQPRTSSITASMFAALLLASPAGAEHPNGGNCAHTHTGRVHSVCDGSGTSCTKSGRTGRCKQISAGCQCFTTNAEIQADLISVVEDGFGTITLMASRDGRRLKKLNSNLISAQLYALFTLIDPALEQLHDDAESGFDLSDPAYLSVIDLLLVQHATVFKEYKKHLDKSDPEVEDVKEWQDTLLDIKFALLTNVEAWAEPDI